jgi:hypothetical protein
LCIINIARLEDDELRVFKELSKLDLSGAIQWGAGEASETFADWERAERVKQEKVCILAEVL